MFFAVWVHQQLPPVSGDGEVWRGDLGQTEVWAHTHILMDNKG